MHSDPLRLSGEITRGNPRDGRIVRQFSFWLHFIDAEGKSVGHRVIANSRSTGRGTRLSVNQNIELPPKTDAIAFGYSLKCVLGYRSHIPPLVFHISLNSGKFTGPINIFTITTIHSRRHFSVIFPNLQQDRLM